MWIALSEAFLSAVCPKRADFAKAVNDKLVPRGARIADYLCVRARDADHLRECFPGAKIATNWGVYRDYPARAFILRKEVANFVYDKTLGIGYTNFKDSVSDRPLHDAYMDIWSAMNRFGRGAYDLIRGKKGHQPGDFVPWDRPMGDAGCYDDGDFGDDADQNWHPRAGLTQALR